MKAGKQPKRVPHAKALVVLDQLLDRAQTMNTDPQSIHRIEKIYLFGSLMRGEETVGDIDVHVEYGPDEAFWRKGVDRREKIIDEMVGKIADHPDFERWEGRSWSPLPSKREWLFRRALYGPKRHTLISPPVDLIAQACPCRLIFDRHRGGRVNDPILPYHPRSNPAGVGECVEALVERGRDAFRSGRSEPLRPADNGVPYTAEELRWFGWMMERAKTKR